MRGRGLFVAGTGTGVGKTVATGALLRRLRQAGAQACTMKPVETGVAEAALLGEDLRTHDGAAGTSFPGWEEARAPYRYRAAVSPHLAAEAEGAPPPSPEKVLEAYRTLVAAFSPVLVEGAGGLLVPLDRERLLVDLVQALALPVLLVAPLGLGSINHTLLSIEALAARGIPLEGVVFCENVPGTPTVIGRDNPATIAAFSGAPVRAVLPHCPVLDDEAWTRLSDAFDGTWIGGWT